jgi:hypothetical protein
MSLVERLRGCSDDEIVRALQKQMLLGGNAEATEFLRSLPPERADGIRWKLVEALENIGKKKAQKSAPAVVVTNTNNKIVSNNKNSSNNASPHKPTAASSSTNALKVINNSVCFVFCFSKLLKG